MRSLLFGTLFWCLAAQAQTSLSYADFSKSFRCPEDLPTDKAREKSVQTFLTWVQQSHPNLTIRKTVELRAKLLEEHYCEKTLANMRSSSALVENGSPRNLCTSDDGRRYFSDELAAHCVPVPLEHGWANFHSEPKVVVDVMPSKRVKERDGTKIWAQFFLAEPVPSDDGRWSYDYVKSITKYFCGTKQQLLIQGTYSLKGSRVYERSATESLMEEIEPGTLAEGLYNYACKK